jgi:hypothetical protein
VRLNGEHSHTARTGETRSACLRRVSSDDIHAHEKQLKQNSLSNNTSGAAVMGRETAHTQQQEQQQEQQDEHKELENRSCKNVKSKTQHRHTIEARVWSCAGARTAAAAPL